jgi:hypothetical protein
MHKLLFVLLLACTGPGSTTAPPEPTPTATPVATPEPTPEPTPAVQRCGGIAGMPCPEGATCVDDPSDSCDPTQGGADCGGLCQTPARPAECRDPAFYVGSSETCPRIRFTCDEGKQPFFDACGCGCEPAQAE